MRAGIAVAAALFLVAALAFACGDGNGPPSPADEATQPANGETESTPDGNGGPPSLFDEIRDDFAGRLTAIGANIGFVPDDVRADLLDRCHALAEHASEDAVQRVCSGVERAMDTGDFGLIDLVLEQLEALEGG